MVTFSHFISCCCSCWLCDSKVCRLLFDVVSSIGYRVYQWAEARKACFLWALLYFFFSCCREVIRFWDVWFCTTPCIYWNRFSFFLFCFWPPLQIVQYLLYRFRRRLNRSTLFWHGLLVGIMALFEATKELQRIIGRLWLLAALVSRLSKLVK